MPSGKGRSTKPGRLTLTAEGSLREGLLNAFEGVLVYAREQDVEADPPRTVHEYRKSIRRARAALRLMKGFVGVDGFELVNTTLREVHRSTSDLRDRHVVPGVLDGLGLDPEDSEVGAMADALRASIHAVPAPGPEVILEVLRVGNARIVALPQILAGAMPARVKWFAVRDGLATSHRRARRRLRAAERAEDDESIHGLRKRVKELNYQVELFGELGGSRVRKRRKRLSALSEKLGQLADLMVLRGYVCEHTSAGPVQSRLLEVIEDKRRPLLAHALERADELLDESSPSFARKVTRTARKRRKRG